MNDADARSDRPPTWHASCVARGGHAVLLLGESGCGKSDLALRLIDRGFGLVADDRVHLVGGMAFPPDALCGLLEVRGVGILRVEAVFPVPLALAVSLRPGIARLPSPLIHAVHGVPLLHLDPMPASAALKVEIALDCVLGGRTLLSGFVEKTCARSMSDL